MEKKRVAEYLKQALEHPFEFMFKCHPEPAIRKSMAFTHSRGFSKLAHRRIEYIILETGNKRLRSKTFGEGLSAFASLAKRFIHIKRSDSEKNTRRSSRKSPSQTGPKRL